LVLIRFPFVAADILSSSAKLADAFIEELKVEESAPASPQKDSPLPALITQDEASKDTPTPEDKPHGAVEKTSEALAVENALKQ
jgi:hypothetical protein